LQRNVRAFLLELGDRGIDAVQPPILALAVRQINDVERWLSFRADARRREIEMAERQRQEEEEEARRVAEVERRAEEARRAAEVERQAEEAHRAAEIERQQMESVRREEEERIRREKELEEIRGRGVGYRSRTNSMRGSDEEMPAGFRAGTDEFEVPVRKPMDQGEPVIHETRVSRCVLFRDEFRVDQGS
jgi:uncharacterized membrane protein YqiK